MQAFKNHKRIIDDYREFLKSFLNINDERIKAEVEEKLHNDSYLPEPLIQFNPTYKAGISIDELSTIENIHLDLKKMLGKTHLYHHQVEAIKKGLKGEGFIVTSGTGSGKSLKWFHTKQAFFRHISTTFEEGVFLKHTYQQYHFLRYLFSIVASPASPTAPQSQNNPDKYAPFPRSSRKN